MKHRGKHRATGWAAWIVIAVVAAPLPGGAQERTGGDLCQASATPEQKEKARALLEDGYGLHEELRFADAALRYREALGHWDHPDIHLALARVLFNDAKLLDAHGHVSAAVRCARALENDEEREQARALLQRLRTQLAEIVVDSPDAGTEILLNGSLWFQGAGRRSTVVYPGQYVVVARRAGYVPVTRPLTLAANQQAVVAPQLVSVADATTVTRRWERQVPRALAGAGIALAMVGAGLQWRAAVDFDAFDGEWQGRCGGGEPLGCSELMESELVGRLQRARWEQRAAMTSFVVGGATLLAGLAMFVLDQPRSRVDESAGDAPLQLMPLVSRDSVGMGAGFSF